MLVSCEITTEPLSARTHETVLQIEYICMDSQQGSVNNLNMFMLYICSCTNKTLRSCLLQTFLFGFVCYFYRLPNPCFIYGQQKHVAKFTLGTFLQRVQSNVNEALQSINAVCSKRLKINMQILNQMLLKFSLQNCATTTLAFVQPF